MYSALQRTQAVFGFATTVYFTVAALIALSSFIQPQNPKASLQLRNVQVVKGRPHYYSYKREEYAHIKFDLDVDLTSLFGWNTKQVFIYVKAIYPGLEPSEPASEAVIWDAILASDSAPWNENHFIHPSPKSTKPAKKSAKKAESPYPRGELHLPKQRPKYQITDITGKLQNRTDAVLEVGWNVQPWVGALTWNNKVDIGVWQALQGGTSRKFDFPEIVAKKKKDDLQTEKGKEGHRLMAGEEQPKRRPA